MKISAFKKIFHFPIVETIKDYMVQCIIYAGKFKFSNKMTFWRKLHIFLPTKNMDAKLSYAKQFSKITRGIKPTLGSQEYFYPFNSLLLRILPQQCQVLASMTVDFGKVIESNLQSLKKEVLLCPEGAFQRAQLSVLNDIERLIDRTCTKFSRSSVKREREIGEFLNNIKNGKPSSLDEALQRILFFNALFWQMQHYHIGLGRLDKILYPYYKDDIEGHKITRGQAKKMLIDFCDTLHKDCKAKSVGAIGDTGQYILLGGCTKATSSLENDITHLFLEIFAEHPYADPKLILRVNGSTSDHIWKLAVKSISHGSGSPLLMNEDRVIDTMREFGYDEEDLSEVGTSACWEPLIIGKSMDQNNPFSSINLLQNLNIIISQHENARSFTEFKQQYLDCIKDAIKRVVPEHKLFDVSPLFSLFFDDCLKRNKDFSEGGARYAWHGAQCIGLPNTINALLNIENFVFDKKLITLKELKDALESDFKGYEDIRMLLKSGENKFGQSSNKVISLTNEIMTTASLATAGITCNGNKIKIGFSSPNYINLRQHTGTSADGRIKGEPLAVHISPTSTKIDISEVLDFATKLDYSGNRLNGNVVDFILTQSYIKNPIKLTSLLKNACSQGVFEIQLNVVDKATLVDAKLHPELHKDLIVRVWGFSAYFNDLPEAYKDSLIERAETYEA